MRDVRKPVNQNSTRLIDRVRIFIRSRNLAFTTEKAYIYWIVRFIRFNHLRHPKEMTKIEVGNYLDYMAYSGNYSQSTQRLALNSLVFFYQQFLNVNLGNLHFSKVKREQKVPAVFSQGEATIILSLLTGKYALAAKLIYGSGLRISEVGTLRVKDIDFALNRIIVDLGKGNKDRLTLLPDLCIEPLKVQLAITKSLHQEDLANGFGEVYLPKGLTHSYLSTLLCNSPATEWM